MGFFDKAEKVAGKVGKAIGKAGRKIGESDFSKKLNESGTIVEKIKQMASRLNKRIVLCEGEDSRVVEAASL